MDDTANVPPVGKTIQRLLDAGRDAAKDWQKQGDEIERYTTSNDYGFLYQEFEADQSFQARVNKASEFCQIFGAFLYPHNPDASVNSESWADQWARARHVIEEQYADYSARHGELAKQMRRCVDHALLRGRGVMWTGYNDKKGIVQDIFDRADNLIVDPDAKTVEEQNWQARKRVKPRWELMARYPDSAAIIQQLPVYGKPDHGKKQSDAQSDLICYYEVWMGVGASNYMQSMEVVTGDQIETNAKKKYVIADGKVLYEGDWEIPFFHIDEWPGSYLDLIERPGCVYPLQPMEPGMGHLRAMNYAYTTFITKWRYMSRTPFAAITHNGQGIESDQLFKVLRGEHIDVLLAKFAGTDEPPDINKYFQRIDWGDPVPGFERLWQILSSEFEKSTGLAEVLYSGTTPTQLRSAKAAELVEQNSRTRSDSMRESVTQFLEKIYRKRLFAARFLHPSEDIGKLFGPEAAKIWGEIASPEAVAREQQPRMQMYQDAAMQGMPPEQVDQIIGPPALVDMDAWIHEADRTIDAGSMRRMDLDAQIQNLNVALNQLAPSLVNMPGGGEFVSALAAEFAEKNRMSPELVGAARNIATQITMQQQMMLAAPTTGAAPPAAPPQTGPTGGTPPPA